MMAYGGPPPSGPPMDAIPMQVWTSDGRLMNLFPPSCITASSYPYFLTARQHIPHIIPQKESAPEKPSSQFAQDFTPPSHTLYVSNLHEKLTEKELKTVRTLTLSKISLTAPLPVLLSHNIPFHFTLRPPLPLVFVFSSISFNDCVWIKCANL